MKLLKSQGYSNRSGAVEAVREAISDASTSRAQVMKRVDVLKKKRSHSKALNLRYKGNLSAIKEKQEIKKENALMKKLLESSQIANVDLESAIDTNAEPTPNNPLVVIAPSASQLKQKPLKRRSHTFLSSSKPHT